MQGTHSRWHPPPPSPVDLSGLGVPSELADALTRFQRILLTTDGTVTHILEAYADEPVDVVKLVQVIDQAGAGDGQLGLSSRDQVVRRRVLLRSRYSQRNLLYAEAVVAVDRVDPMVLDGLVQTDKPIGVLLAENRLETFRQILRLEEEPARDCGTYFGVDPAAPVLSRTYRIIFGGEPAVLITEKFPPTFFRDLAR